LWGSVNYGQSLHGLHNTIRLRIPALENTIDVCIYQHPLESVGIFDKINHKQ